MTDLAIRSNFFNDLFDFRRDFDQFFSSFLSNWPWSGQTTSPTVGFVPAVEAMLDPNAKKYHLRVALPGVDPDHVELEVQGTTLFIRGERQLPQKSEECDYLLREFTYGRFERQVTIPEGVDTDKLTAEYHNGVLEITAPVSAAVLPRRIPIKGLTEAKRTMAA
jgi:HSP20 family protein